MERESVYPYGNVDAFDLLAARTTAVVAVAGADATRCAFRTGSELARAMSAEEQKHINLAGCVA